MKTAVGGVAVAGLAAAVLIVVVMVGPATATLTHTGQRICTAMLGNPPDATATVATLQDAQAQSLAPAGLSGQNAYRFVATLNTVINWRHLAAAQVAAWAADPSATSLPEGAQLDTPWPAPSETTPPTTIPRPASLYEEACAAILRRADTHVANPPHTTTRTPNPNVPNTSSSQPSAIVAEVTRQLGTPMSSEALWQWISATPHLDPKRTLFEQLTRTAPVPAPRAGNLACYDFTLSGPAHCALILTSEPQPSMATIAADGVLAATPLPANCTIVETIAAQETR